MEKRGEARRAVNLLEGKLPTLPPRETDGGYKRAVRQEPSSVRYYNLTVSAISGEFYLDEVHDTLEPRRSGGICF